MKSIILILTVAQITCLATLGMANSAIEVVPKEKEDETLISGKIALGYYGALIVKFTELNDQSAVLIGGRGGLIINHAFVIGGGGYGLVNDIDTRNFSSYERRFLDFGYGGLVLEYINRSHKLVHLSVHSLIGGGSLCYRDYLYYDWYDDVFFVAEPGIDLMLNVSKHFRIGLGGSYRFVSGIDMDGLNNADISGPSAALTFKFGRF